MNFAIEPLMLTLIIYSVFLYIFYRLFLYWGAKGRSDSSAQLLKQGELFLDQILQISPHNSSSNFELIKYKYFTALVHELLSARKRMGAPIGEAMLEVKKACYQDLNFEKKLFSCFMGGVIQMVMVVMFLLLFLSIGCYELEVSFPRWLAAGIIFISCVAFFAYSICARRFKVKSFRPFERLVQTAYTLKTCFHSQIPLGQVLGKADLDELVLPKEHTYLKTRLETILKGIKLEGRVDFEEVDMYIANLWLSVDLEQEKYSKQLAGFKFAILAFVFLPMYLFSVLSFIKSIAV